MLLAIQQKTFRIGNSYKKVFFALQSHYSVASMPLQEEFSLAYDEYADAIFRHCYFRVRDRDLAIDLMQETFMKTWGYLSKGKTVDNIRAFLYKTANNLIIDHVRRAKLRPEDSFEEMQEQGFDITGEDGRDIAQKMDAEQVVTVLQKVDEPYRTAVIMRYIDELEPKEIAKVLHISANSVSVRINRGLKKLESLLPKKV